MRILIVDTYYEAFLRSVYAAHPAYAALEYEQQRAALMAECFGTADYYSSNLQQLGHEATEVVANCRPLQLQWAKEHGVALPYRLQRCSYGGIPLPRLGREWGYPVLLAQVKAYRPDVVHFQDPMGTPAAVIRGIRPVVRFISGQIASPIAPRADFSGYDLMLSSFPHFVGRFRQQGLRAEYLRLAFEPKVLPRLRNGEGHRVVFVGGLSAGHADRIQLLEKLAREQRIDWWGYGDENLSPGSPLRATYHGAAWALEMYEQLFNARIALNHHIDIAEGSANNMRLYEATGVGTLLITDWKANLQELFEPGKEVVAYHTPEECGELIKHYLERDEERDTIARAGQERTRREHTYYHRMQEFVDIVRRHI